MYWEGNSGFDCLGYWVYLLGMAGMSGEDMYAVECVVHVLCLGELDVWY